MQIPTEVKITSHRPVIGWFLVAYKKLIMLLIAPYLRNVFEEEHSILEARFAEAENSIYQQLLPKLNQVDSKLNQVDSKLNQVGDLCKELIKRMDSIAIILSQRQDEMSQRQDEMSQRQDEMSQRQDEMSQRQDEMSQRQDGILNKVETLRYRFEYYIGSKYDSPKV